MDPDIRARLAGLNDLIQRKKKILRSSWNWRTSMMPPRWNPGSQARTKNQTRGESGVNSIGMLRNPRLIVVQAYPAQSQWSPVLVQRFPGPNAGRCKMRNRRAVRALRIADVLQRPTSYLKHQHNETFARCPFSRSAVRPRTNPANKRRTLAGYRHRYSFFA
jgi:hypothetical protein